MTLPRSLVTLPSYLTTLRSNCTHASTLFLHLFSGNTCSWLPPPLPDCSLSIFPTGLPLFPNYSCWVPQDAASQAPFICYMSYWACLLLSYILKYQKIYLQCWHLYSLFFFYYLFERQKLVWGRSMGRREILTTSKRATFHMPVVAKAGLGSKQDSNSIQVFLWGGGNPITGAMLCHPPGCASARRCIWSRRSCVWNRILQYGKQMSPAAS